jgi:hypothetical protein
MATETESLVHPLSFAACCVVACDVQLVCGQGSAAGPLKSRQLAANLFCLLTDD